MKYWFSVTYGETRSKTGMVCSQEATRAEAERQVAYFVGYYRALNYTIFKVELERLHKRGPNEVLELPMQIAMWVFSE